MKYKRIENKGRRCRRNKPGQGSSEFQSLPSLLTSWIPTGGLTTVVPSCWHCAHCTDCGPEMWDSERPGAAPKRHPAMISYWHLAHGFPIFFHFCPLILMCPQNTQFGRNKDSNSAQTHGATDKSWNSNESILLFLCSCRLGLKLH